MSGSSEKHLVMLAQSLRKAHCSADENVGHECVGTCKITAAGIELDCKLCGKGDERHAPDPKGLGVERARRVLRAAGVSWDSLNATAQIAVIRECSVDDCPHCKNRRPAPRYSQDYYRCDCGVMVWNRRSGWYKPKETP